MNRVRSNIAGFGLVVLAMLLGACSSDTHLYYSSIDRPTTITLYDSMQHKPLWVKDIPVGYNLELDFDRTEDTDGIKTDPRPATRMSWRLFEPHTPKPPKASRANPKFAGEKILPGTPVVIKVTYRPSPEYLSNENEIQPIIHHKTSPTPKPAGDLSTNQPETDSPTLDLN